MEDATARTGNIYAVMVAAATWVLAFMLTQPIYPLYVRDLGATPLQIGMLISLSSALSLVLQIPLTLVAERVGKTRMLVFGLVISSTSRIMYAYAGSFSQLPLIVAYAALTAGFNQLAMSIVSDMAPATSQGDALGRYLTFLGVGMLLGPALCSVLIASLTYQQLYLISAGIPVLGIALLLVWAPRVPGVTTRIERPKIGARESLGRILRNRNVMLLSYCRLSFSTGQSLFMTLFSIYATEDLGISASTVALLFTVRGLTNVLTRYPVGRLSDRIGRKKPIIAAFSALTVAFLITATQRSTLLLGVAMTIYGLSWGTRAVTEWALLTDLVEPEIKTISMSYMSSIFGLGSTLGSILAGVLSLYLPFTTIFLIAAAIIVPPIPVISMMKRPEGGEV
jgi:predicted MFS family arabinose efflux permease